jgi:hypothetical protein
MTPAEVAAVREDASRRLEELRAVAKSLWCDRDDPAVMSELVVVMGEIRGAERELRADELRGES